MKKLISILALVMGASSLIAADAANDVLLNQRNGANDDNVQRNVTATANSLFAFDGSLIPTATAAPILASVQANASGGLLLKNFSGTTVMNVGPGSGTGVAFNASGLTSVNSVTAADSTALTLTGGSTGASLVLGATTSGAATLTSPGSPNITTTGNNAINFQVYPAGTGSSAALSLFNNSSLGSAQYGQFSSVQNGGSPELRIITGANTGSTPALVFSPGGEKARLTSTGNLLIGTTTDMTGSGGLKIAGTTPATTTTSGALIVAGGVGVSGAGYFGGGLNVTGGGATLNLGTETTTGARIVQFGSTYGSGSLNFQNGVTVAASLASTGLTSNVGFRAGVGSGPTAVDYGWSGASGLYSPTANNISIANNNARVANFSTTALILDYTTSASSSTVGALTIGNGTAATNVAIGGGKVNIGSTEASTGVGSGALQVAGGIYAGAASVFGGTVTANGAVTGGIARATSWSLDNSLAYFGHSSAAGAAGTYAMLHNAAGNTQLNGTSTLTLNINNSPQLSLASGAATFAGAVTGAGLISTSGSFASGRAFSGTTPSGSSVGLRLLQTSVSDWQIENTATTGALTFAQSTVPYFTLTTTAATFASAVVTTSATLSGAGAIPITTSLVKFTSTAAANALTLANGVDGQRLTIVHDVKGTLGTGVLTPTTKTGFTTVTFTSAGDTVSLVYVTTRGWMVTGSYLATIAP